MRFRSGGSGMAGRFLAAMLLTLAAIAAARSQGVEDEVDDDATEVGQSEDAAQELCPGDGDAIDTEEELAEFAAYDDDELFVLDDDSDCLDNEPETAPYNSTGNPQVLTSGILPLLAAGRAASPPGDAPAAPARMVPRSSGGRVANDAEAPWQVQIFQPWTMAQLNQWGMTTGGRALWEFQHLCGATLVADNWALTASHCLPPSAATTGYRVRLGAETIHNDSVYTYRIDRVVPFSGTAGPASNGVWRIHDISLIHFTDDRNVGRPSATQARAIAIDRGPSLADEAGVYATGWGRLSNQSAGPASVMMKVQMNIVTNDRCARGPWGTNFVHDMVLCAAAPGRQTCQGDSGGPLVNSVGPPRLVGVVSWNNADCIGDVGRQGIYTRVARYAAWIDRTIR